MAIVQTVNFHAFRSAFYDMGRKDQYSPEALEMIFDYLEEYSDSTGEPVELDVIGICCEMSEMTYTEAAEAYNIDVSDCEDDEELREAILDHIGYHSTVVGYNDDVIVFVAF